MKKLLCCLAAVIALAACDTAGLTTPAGELTPLAFGMGVHSSPPQVISWMTSVGIKWVRVTAYYQTVHDSDATTELLAQIDGLHAAGIKTLLVVHSTPWDDPDGTGIPAYLVNLLQRTAGIAAVEVYNEENVGVDYWRPVLPGSNDRARGQAYAARYSAVRDSIKNMLPFERRVPVLSGGTAGDPGEFLLGIRDEGVTPDIIAIHAYGFPPALEMSLYAASSRSVFPHVPVWVTEVGSEGGRTDSTTLKLDIEGVFAWMRQNPDVRAFWYCMYGDTVDAVLNSNFTERPSARMMRAASPFR